MARPFGLGNVQKLSATHVITDCTAPDNLPFDEMVRDAGDLIPGPRRHVTVEQLRYLGTRQVVYGGGTCEGETVLVSDTASKAELKAFLKVRQLPDPIGPGFVRALQEVLSGLEKVILRAQGLQNALSDGGVPCTLPDLHERFDRYLAMLTKGKDATKVRIIVE